MCIVLFPGRNIQGILHKNTMNSFLDLRNKNFIVELTLENILKLLKHIFEYTMYLQELEMSLNDKYNKLPAWYEIANILADKQTN